MDEDDSEVYDDVVDAADSADESLLSSEAFQPSEWINCGKVWADPMPSHVFNAAWLGGAQSLSLRADSPHESPLYPEKSSIAWFSGARHSAPAASSTLAVECQETFEVLPSSGPVIGFSPVHLTMHGLSRLLSNRWLDDEIMNAGLNYILRDL
ncbi:hypothetical protein BC629DRAFT_1597370 [Irpex lacteus]|nr:hypothetical protein BC629DRAFT_1597370 [Irpex lacteus]